MIELEKTYLAKALPARLKEYPSKKIIDIYIPHTNLHPQLRLRKNGDVYEMTKKTPVRDDDASAQKEQTILLSTEEFNALKQHVAGKRIHKMRYYYDYNGRTFEWDVFLDDLTGLVLVDVEFETEAEKEQFDMPNFCLADVTQEMFIAGGMLCGKSYKEIAEELKRFDYAALSLT